MITVKFSVASVFVEILTLIFDVFIKYALPRGEIVSYDFKIRRTHKITSIMSQQRQPFPLFFLHNHKLVLRGYKINYYIVAGSVDT